MEIIGGSNEIWDMRLVSAVSSVPEVLIDRPTSSPCEDESAAELLMSYSYKFVFPIGVSGSVSLSDSDKLPSSCSIKLILLVSALDGSGYCASDTNSSVTSGGCEGGRSGICPSNSIGTSGGLSGCLVSGGLSGPLGLGRFPPISLRFRLARRGGLIRSVLRPLAEVED